MSAAILVFDPYKWICGNTKHGIHTHTQRPVCVCVCVGGTERRHTAVAMVKSTI